jgi:hypothetical protein
MSRLEVFSYKNAQLYNIIIASPDNPIPTREKDKTLYRY